MSERRILLSLCLMSAAALAPGQSPSPEPLTLRRAVELALERAPSLAAARSAREEADARAALAKDAFHPEAYLTTTPGYTYGFPGLVAGHVPSLAGVEIHQTIFDPSRGAELLRARAGETAAAGAFERSCRQTVEATVVAYARAWADRLAMDAARRRMDAAESLAKRSASLTQEGRQTELELERVKLRAARARQKLLNAQSDLDLDQLELKRLIGWPASAALVLASDPASALGEAEEPENLAAARSSDPELLALEGQIGLLEKSAGYEAKRWLPVIEASLQYQRLAKFNNYDKYYLTFTPDSVALGVSIGIPLWTGGRATDSLRGARARLDHAQAERAGRESDLTIAVQRAEAAVASAAAERSLAMRSRGIAEQTLEETRLLLREGRGGATDLDEREIALADAEEEAAKADLSALQGRASLLALRGELARSMLGAERPCRTP
jgi:outer membrane protein TolC